MKNNVCEVGVNQVFKVGFRPAVTETDLAVSSDDKINGQKLQAF